MKVGTSGELFGIMCNQTLAVLGFNLESNKESLNYHKIQNNFPTEIDLCGLIKFGLCSDTEAHLNEILQDVDITDNPILLNCELGTSTGLNLKASLFKHGQLEAIPYEVISEEELYRQFFFVRLQCDLDLLVEENEKSIKDSMLALRKRLASGNVAFVPENSQVILNGNKVVGISPEGQIEELLEITTKTTDEGVPLKNKKRQQHHTMADYQIMNVSVLLKKSKDGQDEKLKREACKVILDVKNR